MRRRVLTVLLALALVPFGGCLGGSAPDGGTAADAGDTAAPAWWFTDLQGVTHARETTAGDPVVLFFMATWCGSCKQKAPMLADVEDEYAERGVRFLSASIDPQDEDARLTAWQERYDNDWPHGRDANASLQNTFGIRAQSSLVVLDGAGRVVAKWQYPGASEEALRRALDEAVARGRA